MVCNQPIITVVSSVPLIVFFRCVVTTVDMDTGVKSSDGEPLETLKR